MAKRPYGTVYQPPRLHAPPRCPSKLTHHLLCTCDHFAMADRKQHTENNLSIVFLPSIVSRHRLRSWVWESPSANVSSQPNTGNSLSCCSAHRNNASMS